MSKVYFIQAGKEDVFKIGITNGSPTKRLAMLQTGNHLQLSVYAYVSANDAREVEARIHQQYAHRRLAGEWFNLTPDEVERIIQEENGQADSRYIEVLKMDQRGKSCQHYLYEKETGVLYSDVANWEKVFTGLYSYLLATAVEFYMDGTPYINYDTVIDFSKDDREAYSDLVEYKSRLVTAALKFETGQQTVTL